MLREHIHKRYPLELKDLNDTSGEVVFYFAAWTKDLENDIILKTAYNKTIVDNFKSFYHNRDHQDACGVPKSMGVDDKGAFCVSKLAIKTMVGNDVYEQYKAGIIKGHSQEFNIIQDTFDTTLNARIIKEVRLWGVTSVTNIPANLDTHTLSVKSLHEVSKQLNSLQEILHKGNISEDLGMRLERQYKQLQALLTNLEQKNFVKETENKPKESKSINNLLSKEIINNFKLF